MDAGPESSITLQLILIVVLTLINAYFAASEMAIVSVNKNKIRRLSEEGNKKAKLVEKLLDQPTNFLSTIQVAITLAGFFNSASAATGISVSLANLLKVWSIRSCLDYYFNFFYYFNLWGISSKKNRFTKSGMVFNVLC